MTVHKSQGSEFDRVLLALPPYESPLLSRQIIYTGITRARSYVLILGTEAILRKAIGIQEERPGGVALKACE
jgi:exodeoxyribonuclease V alpha subunit